MSMTFAINEASDLTINSSGALVLTNGENEVKQRILISLKHHWQEYFLNVPAGVPWYDLILGGKDLNLYEAILRKIILEVPGVLNLIRFETSIKNRVYTISLTAEVGWETGTSVASLTTTPV